MSEVTSEETSRARRILLVGAAASTNLGDPLLLHCAAWLLHREEPEAEIVLCDISGGGEEVDLCRPGQTGSAEMRQVESRSRKGTDASLPSYRVCLRRRWSHMVRAAATRLSPVDLTFRQRAAEAAAHRPAQKAALEKLRPDAIVFGGGQVFSDWYGLEIAGWVGLAREKNIPVTFSACGMGDLKSRRIRKALGAALHFPNVAGISLRDGAETFRSYWPDLSVREVMDPGIHAGEAFAARAEMPAAKSAADEAGVPAAKSAAAGVSGTCELSVKADKKATGAAFSPKSGRKTSSGVDTGGEELPPLVGLGPIFSWKAGIRPGREIAFFCRVIALLEERGLRWTLFTNGSPEDTALAMKILEKLGRTGQVLPVFGPAPGSLKARNPIAGPSQAAGILPAAGQAGPTVLRPLTPEGLTATIASFDGILSFRLHSHIVAYSLDLPSIAIDWDPKVGEFFRKTGHPDRVLPPQVSPKEAADAILSAMKAGGDHEEL